MTETNTVLVFETLWIANSRTHTNNFIFIKETQTDAQTKAVNVIVIKNTLVVLDTRHTVECNEYLNGRMYVQLCIYVFVYILVLNDKLL